MVFHLREAGWAPALLAVIFSLAILPTATVTATAKDRKAHLIFGFLPVVSTDMLVKRFEPLTDYLSKELGVQVRLETAPDYATFQHRTVNEKHYDFLYTAPHLYYLAQRDAGYRAVARVDSRKLAAIIVVRKESPVTSLKDLCGKKMATPSRLALVTIILRGTVAKIGCKKGDQVVIMPTPSHNAALLNVYNRTSDAAGLSPISFKMAAAVSNSMRVIDRTGVTPHVPIAIAPWVDKKTAGKFTKIILSLEKTKEGRAVLKKTALPGFKAATPQEYDVMKPYTKFIKY